MKPNLPRILLTPLPTPVEFLPRLTRALGGAQIFVKRDDLTGLAGGGNKARKLELLVGDALARGADTLVTLGSAQSNHCRQTAAAAARCGLRAILVLGGAPPPDATGNLLLDHLLGAELRWSGTRAREEVMDETVGAERGAGRKPYAVPLGGSNGLGAAAYALALQELVDQMESQPGLRGARFDRIVFASSSGGTHAGLAAGARRIGFRGQILGISIDAGAEELRRAVATIANQALDCLGAPERLSESEISVSADYLGGGYGGLGPPEREAIDLFARQEGLLLDPVYTARAAAGMIDLVRRGAIGQDETVLFWHTGGIPALWAYGAQLVP